MTLSLTDPDIQEAIHALEVEKEIRPIQKALILMVADGKKPATWQQVTSEKWTEGNEEALITPARWQELNDIFGKLGLVSVIRTQLNDTAFVQPSDGTHQWVELADIFLSRDKTYSNKLAEAVKRKDHRQIGMLLGFPQSAVDAFMSKDTLPISEWPISTETVSAESMRFLNHMLSKNNWDKEIDYLPASSQRIKELSNMIYQDCLKQI